MVSQPSPPSATALRQPPRGRSPLLGYETIRPLTFVPRRLEKTRSESSFESITESEDEAEEALSQPTSTLPTWQRTKRSLSVAAGSASPCRPRRLSALSSLRLSQRKNSLPNLSRDPNEELLPPIPEAPVTSPANTGPANNVGETSDKEKEQDR